MKTVLILLFIATQLSCTAQLPVNKKMDWFKTNYNAQQFAAIYKDLSIPFKKEIAEQELVDFLQSWYMDYGKVNQVVTTYESEFSGKYKMYAEKDSFKISLDISMQNLVEGIQLEKLLASKNFNSIKHNNPLKTTMDSLVHQEAKKYFDKNNGVGIIIGISNNGTRNYYGYGETKINNQEIPTANHIFEIGSITKTFTGSLLSKAIVDKKIKIDDPIKKYLPTGLLLNKDEAEITFKHLTTHTSGLAGLMTNYTDAPNFDNNNPYKTYTEKLLFDYMKKNGATAKPGEKHAYSNWGVGLLGVTLSKVYKKSYEKLLQEFIWKPLNMNSTSLSVAPKNLSLFVDGHDAANRTTSHWGFDCMAPAGGIISNATDMLNYFEAQWTNTLKFSSQAHQSLFTLSANSFVGMNWFTQKFGANEIVWHNGGTGGFSTFGGFLKNNKTAIIIMANKGIVGSTDVMGFTILNKLVKNKHS
jgi:CubicO group peptidase (beta-lactamase class C family)